MSINSVLPAIVAGNAVILKPSPQTPLTAERFALALTNAGVPKEIIQVIHMSPELVTHAIENKNVEFVSFTGSVEGGHAIQKAASLAPGFTGVGLEVSGCRSRRKLHLRAVLSLEGKTLRTFDQTQTSTLQLQSLWMVSRLFAVLSRQTLYENFLQVLSSTLVKAAVLSKGFMFMNHSTNPSSRSSSL